MSDNPESFIFHLPHGTRWGIKNRDGSVLQRGIPSKEQAIAKAAQLLAEGRL